MTWWRALLVLYWCALAISTHYPSVPMPDTPGSDKLIHAATFGGLALLWWCALRVRNHRSAPLSALVLLSYAAIDEYAQQWFGRHTDIADWLADAIGISIVLVVAEAYRRRLS